MENRLQLKIGKGKRTKRTRTRHRHTLEQLAFSTSFRREDFEAAQILMTLATAPHYHIAYKPSKQNQVRPVKLHESTDLESVDFDPSKLEWSFSCKTCSRKFSSFQALGGHRGSCFNKPKFSNGRLDMHQEEQATDDLDILEETERGYTNKDPENFQSFQVSKGIYPNMGTEANNQGSIKRAKVHKCPFCYKVFSCGQALGGHRRCHRTCLSTVEATSSLSSIEHQQIPSVKTLCLLDLNMPAPLDADDEKQDSNGSCFQRLTYPFPDHYDQKFGMGPFDSRPEWGSMEINRLMFHPKSEAHSRLRFNQLQNFALINVAR